MQDDDKNSSLPSVKILRSFIPLSFIASSVVETKPGNAINIQPYLGGSREDRHPRLLINIDLLLC